MTEMWTVGVGLPGMAAKFAVAAEEAGWDGLAIVDSQNLSGDVYVALTMAARETSTLKVAPGGAPPLDETTSGTEYPVLSTCQGVSSCLPRSFAA